MQNQTGYKTLLRRTGELSEVKDALGTHLQLHSHGLKNTRDLRTLLVEAAYLLLDRPNFTDAQILLHSATLSKIKVQEEFEQFKSIAQRGFATRIEVCDFRAAAQQKKLLADGGALIDSELPRKPSTASQEAVMAYLLQRYLQFLPGVSIGTIATHTKASLPTIYKVMNTYEHCIERNPENKTLRLRHFAPSDWFYWIGRTNKLSSVRFVDRSGAPRSANRLSKALAKMKREDLAVGGLMGALHHMPALDATSSPQLDILVHGTRTTDLSFVTEIDPGLELDDGRTDTAHVVVHFIDRPASLFVYQNGQNWGALPDCIANMQKAGLTHQVNDALQLITQGKKS